MSDNRTFNFHHPVTYIEHQEISVQAGGQLFFGAPEREEDEHEADTSKGEESPSPSEVDPAAVRLRQFFNNDDDALTFVNYARKHSQPKLTDYINTLNKAGNIHFDTKTDLYQALRECGLYNRSDRNFYQRVF